MVALPPPPKYRSADFRKPGYRRLRGALDVPKERFVNQVKSLKERFANGLWNGLYATVVPNNALNCR